MSDRPDLSARLAGLAQGLRTIGHAVPGIDLFAAVTFAPVPLIVLGALFGGLWPWLAVAWIGGLIYALDRLIAHAAPDAPEGCEFPAADRLSVALAVAHFGLLLLGVAALSGATGLSIPARIALFFACGLFFGQVSNSNAHELIHRADKRLFVLGKWVYISLLYGHHASAHRLVHHRFVATRDDPNSAVLGESFWAFAPQAWTGAFTAGWEMEEAQRKRLAPEGWRARLAAVNPYVSYVLGAIWCVLLVGLLFGLAGVLAYLALCLYAQMQILLADYVQHYGLERAQTGTGQYEPVSVRHSWDAPDPVSSLWMLNAPRHSDHHAHPARPYPELRLGETAAAGRPMLPRSLPAMATLALIPALWHRVMDPRARALRKPARGL